MKKNQGDDLIGTQTILPHLGISEVRFFKKKYLLHLLQYCLFFYVLDFCHEECRLLAPLPGIEPAPSSLEGGGLDRQGSPRSTFLYFTQCYPLYVSVRTRSVRAAVLFVCTGRTDSLPEAFSTQSTHVVCTQPAQPLLQGHDQLLLQKQHFASQTE